MYFISTFLTELYLKLLHVPCKLCKSEEEDTNAVILLLNAEVVEEASDVDETNENVSESSREEQMSSKTGMNIHFSVV